MEAPDPWSVSRVALKASAFDAPASVPTSQTALTGSAVAYGQGRPAMTDYDKWRAEARAHCSPESLPGALAMIELDERSVHENPKTVPPCPSWCRLPKGHGYDSVDEYPQPGGPITFLRIHQDRPLGQEGMVGAVTQDEVNCEGHVELREPRIYSFFDNAGEALGPEDARRVAAAWLDLADRFDEIAARSA
jgi:hypothetical protein